MKDLFELKRLVKYESSDGTGRVFISYQSQSFQSVLKISEYLEKRGIYTWYAPRNIELGAGWPEKLEEAIENCKVVLLLYTEQADKSKHVLREINIADSIDKPILWLKLDNSTPTKTLKYFLSLIQTIPYDDEDACLSSLVNILSANAITTEALEGAKEISTCQSTENNPEYIGWSKGIYSFRTAGEAGECVARIYFEQAQNNPDSTLLLPTGRSAKEVFYGMIRASSEHEGCPFGSAKLMNDTETYGVFQTAQTSRIKAILDYLITPLKLMGKAPCDESLTFLTGIDLSGNEPEDVAADSLNKYPVSISAVSVSPYCEIIGYDFYSHSNNIINDGPRTISVNDETKNYIDPSQKSNTIYTVGLKSILSSDLLLILAFDRNKGNAIKRLFNGEADPSFPLTLLRKHKNAYVIVTDDVLKQSGLEEFAKKSLTPLEAFKCIMKKN